MSVKPYTQADIMGFDVITFLDVVDECIVIQNQTAAKNG
jgi:hypothetical protein